MVHRGDEGKGLGVISSTLALAGAAMSVPNPQARAHPDALALALVQLLIDVPQPLVGALVLRPAVVVPLAPVLLLVRLPFEPPPPLLLPRVRRLPSSSSSRGFRHHHDGVAQVHERLVRHAPHLPGHLPSGQRHLCARTHGQPWRWSQ